VENYTSIIVYRRINVTTYIVDTALRQDANVRARTGEDISELPMLLERLVFQPTNKDNAPEMLEYVVLVSADHMTISLLGNYCAVQRSPFSNAFGVSPLHKPNKNLPSCDDILHPDYRKTSCYYQCYSSKKQLVKGTHNDGTRCEKEKFPGRRAHCIRGICILIENEVPKFDSSKPEQHCDGQYYGILDEYKDRVNSVGICQRGICKPFYKLESTNSKIKNKIFAKQYRKCEEVEHYGRNMLKDCHYFCRRGDEWFYGFYKNSYNSACQTFNPRRMSGYCCRGKCLPKEHCRRNIGEKLAEFSSASENQPTV
ncbi:hypothetical protein MRX96_042301, partial [Rhipicephalus microplus]